MQNSENVLCITFFPLETKKLGRKIFDLLETEIKTWAI